MRPFQNWIAPNVHFSHTVNISEKLEFKESVQRVKLRAAREA